MSRDEIDDDVVSFAVSRDEAVDSAPRGAIPQGRSRSQGAGGSGVLARVFATIGFVVAAVACAWAWQLQQALDASTTQLSQTTQRVQSLEDLLSDTDESVAQSTATLGAQLKLVDTETRRLEQRRRELDARIDKLEKTERATASSLTQLQSDANDQSASLKALSADLGSLKRVANDLENLARTARQSQESVERLADGLNKSNLEQAALKKRIADNEEWIESINAFRRQVNASISRLEQSLRSTSPPAQ